MWGKSGHTRSVCAHNVSCVSAPNREGGHGDRHECGRADMDIFCVPSLTIDMVNK